MKILIVNQYFWPENFRINDLALGLQAKGHEVSVFTGKPNFHTGAFYKGYSFFGKSKETWNGIPIYRAPLIPRGKGGAFRLMINYLSFAFFGSIKAFFLRLPADVILVYQQSPVTLALPGIIYKKKNKARLFLYIQDLWPESVVATTHIDNKWIIGLLNRLTNWIYANSDRILIQSRAFKGFLVSRNVSPGKIRYQPNAAESLYEPKPKDPSLKHFFTGKTNIVFAGSIGSAQSFDTLIAAARIVKNANPDIAWTIIGDGRKKMELSEQVEQDGLADVFKFIGFFELEKMPFFFAYADALLISLKKDFIFSLTVPAKLQSYLACGRPVIGSLDGEGRAIIDDAGCGLTSPAEDPVLLAENVLKLAAMPEEERESLAKKALVYHKKNFDRDMLIDQLETELTALHSVS